MKPAPRLSSSSFTSFSSFLLLPAPSSCSTPNKLWPSFRPRVGRDCEGEHARRDGENGVRELRVSELQERIHFSRVEPEPLPGARAVVTLSTGF